MSEQLTALLEENERLREGCRRAREALATAYGHPAGEQMAQAQEQPPADWLLARWQAERVAGSHVIKFFR